MPFDHSYEPETGLLVLQGSGKGSIDEIIDSARRILQDPHLLSARGVMIVAGRVTTADLVSLMASDGSADTRAFTSEEAARAWLLGIEPERSGLRQP